MNAEAMPAMKNAKMPAITTPSVNVEASWRTAGGSRWISRWWACLYINHSFIAVRPHPENAPKRNPFRRICSENLVTICDGRPERAHAIGRYLPEKASTEEGRHHEHDHEH